ncbi:mitochondrial large subunit ribosomal protein-domain-containing protein [Xylaria acuta]|nr:mitochondrial large subunit ribosomal protein-domain-containing protein [Xylaria acuta]
MFFRSLRPPTARVTSLTTTPIRSTTFFGPLCIRTLSDRADATTSEPATTPTPAEPNTPRQLPYFVARNNFKNLSVYQRDKRGGNLKITILKRGEGDLQALKQDIKDALQLPDGDVSVNGVTRHILIKGHKRSEILSFLHTMGF